MLHGHAVGTCMGYGSYLAMLEGFLTEEEFHRIMKLINDLELALWHDVMDNHDLVYAANKKAYSKIGGNLCAPIPKTIGGCGYLNELSRERLDKTVDEYKAICQTYARGGKGIDVLCSDVGLEDPSLVAGAALEGLANKETGNNSNE
jgi:3-dehydroquinate synthase